MNVKAVAAEEKSRLLFGGGQRLKYIPGVLALLAVGMAGKWVANFTPHLEYVLFAIAFGMLISNTVGIPKILAPGIDTYELWLKIGIVLMGARLAMQDLLNIGVVGLALVAVEIFIAIMAARIIGRFFGLSEKLRDLIGVGVGICGVSAIIGATGAIKAKEEDAAYAIAVVLLFGAFMIFFYPLLGTALGLSDQFYGYWTGLSIDNTAEAVAVGFAYSEEAGNIATVVKLARNALMGVVVLILALMYAKKGMSDQVEHKGRFLWERFPKFLIGFALLSLLATAGVFSGEEISAMKNLSNWAFLLAFAGVGFKTRFSDMKAGLKPFFVGLTVDGAICILTFILVAIFIA